MLSEKEIELLEKKYLKKFYHFLKYAEDEMLEGFKTKEKILDDWMGFWKKEQHSDFSVGAERIVYALLNGKGIGQPNSCPVGADLFFETKDAYIHIDLKTVEATGNIGDYAKNIFVGENQNSYKHYMLVGKGKKQTKRNYSPSLPSFYNKGEKNEKICLSYFITILYEKKDINILNINLLSMPNGSLKNIYKHRPLKAGKNPGKVRFNFSETPYFETLFDKDTEENRRNNCRIKIIYMNENKCKTYKKLDFLRSLYKQQKNIK
jgi:hypothetical protein